MSKNLKQVVKKLAKKMSAKTRRQKIEDHKFARTERLVKLLAWCEHIAMMAKKSGGTRSNVSPGGIKKLAKLYMVNPKRTEQLMDKAFEYAA